MFGGADMASRAHIGEDLGVPEDRMSWCETEFDAAKASWGAAFEVLSKNAPAQSIAYDGGTEALTVAVEECGGPNVFYNPD